MRSPWNSKRTAFIVFAAIAMLTGGCLLNPTKPSNDRTEEFKFCWAVLDAFFIFQQNLPSNPYIYDTPSELYAAVEEPYTYYWPPKRAEYVLRLLTTSSAGIGVVIDSVAPGYLIRAVFDDSPAQRAGLEKRDTIVAVDSQSIALVSVADIDGYLLGDVGEQKKLTIRREDTTITITVTLGYYTAPSVITDTLDSLTAYIALMVFSDSTAVPGGSAAEFSQALDETRWSEYTILDLRGNPGGVLEQCIEITSQFVNEGADLVLSQERYYAEKLDAFLTRSVPWEALDRGKAIGRRFYVLVNENTASASEVLVTALKTYRKNDITIVGTTTYGKARGQGLWDTPERGLAQVTYAL
ncbi:MAG: PDZ domain-containing protein, partial [Chitinivibrionales bacterium]|nr:PDZ domain-containing protein [Chitinivibrionales bacterium]MBD3356361.1 PDZ domain-containing protein [Chitinivibrionales bacterium]